MVNQHAHAAQSKTYRYVITETAGYTSLDPLEADSTQNLSVARMVYATPLEISEENHLSSHVLESYSYDSAAHTIKWVVKSGLKFDDGSPLTTDDVAFAVSRMAFTRPQFPVIESIEGVSAWAKQKDGLKSLPGGIKVNGQTITIHLTKSFEHPLFRFCLELFSIIPKRCVDLATNKLACQETDIPASGYYRLTERSRDKLLFVKRDDQPIYGVQVPKQIQFEYFTPEELPTKLQVLDKMTVFAGNEFLFTKEAMQKIEGDFSTKFTPASRFAALLINPHAGPFKDKNCRQYFAKMFRESYSELNEKSKGLEGSIFAKILPGYLSVKDLESERPLSKTEETTCKSVFGKSVIDWGYVESESQTIFVETLKRTLAKVGARPGEPKLASSRKELADLFASGKIGLYSASSGFWALDPAGDVKMLFTPNLHKVLSHVSSDAKLQKLIGELNDDPGSYAAVNRHLFDEATFNVYAHLRRFFASPNKDLLMDVPFAITSPAPWQVFKAGL